MPSATRAAMWPSPRCSRSRVAACQRRATGSSGTGSARSAATDRKSTRLNSSHTVISYSVFFFNDTATTEIYTLSLHDALPISELLRGDALAESVKHMGLRPADALGDQGCDVAVPAVLAEQGGRVPEAGHGLLGDGERSERGHRSEEHTSELQSHSDLVFRLFF